MKITPIKTKDIPGYARTKMMELFDEFEALGCAAVEVDTSGYKSHGSCAAALKKAAERYHLNHIRVINTDKRVFLVNTIRAEEEKK